jgi:ParB family transcriptional regulator, chromosome partitioning protein
VSRRDSKGIFAEALGQISTDEQGAAPAKNSSGSPHLRRVAAGVRELQERGELANRLLSDSERIVELDVGSVVPSAIPDRFEGAYSEQALAEIMESMRTRGQIVPGMVRPIGTSGSFQIVYGRRRLAAAKILGLKFRAVVRELTDEQAVILQGEENAERSDLTYIEKCAFAYAQEEASFRRDVISASLGTNRSHISEMIKIASVIPSDILRIIGPSPTIGRGRWLEFAQGIERDGGLRRLRDVCAKSHMSSLNSDERFNLAFAALRQGVPKENARPVKYEVREWSSTNGRLALTAKRAAKGLIFALAEDDAAKFGDWFLENANQLYADFLKTGPKLNNGD